MTKPPDDVFIHIHEVTYTFAEYPNETVRQVIYLTHEDNDRLVELLVGAVEEGVLMDWDLLPCSPMTLDEFMNVFGDDLKNEGPDVIDEDGYCWACASYGNVHDPAKHGVDEVRFHRLE